MKRRDFLAITAKGLGLVTIGTVYPVSGSEFSKKKILCVGGHPDDPESGCGGTLALLAAAGHIVKAVYLTTGEAGIPGKSQADAATIRRKEAEAACKVLGIEPVFFGQVDGDSVLNKNELEKMKQLFLSEKPDLVFAHWPVDTHKDHQVASLLATQMQSYVTFSLYFYEVCNGMQTQNFHPTDYVDISGTQEQKRKALYCHQSQDPPGIYACGHAAMEDLRGKQIGAKAGEAFVRSVGKKSGGGLLLAELLP